MVPRGALFFLLVSLNLCSVRGVGSNEQNSNKTPEPTIDHCDSDIFPCSDKIVGNLVLIIGYGITLAFAAKMIADGAEMLLDLNLPPAIVGGVVLPVMGAVPDSVMILVSGLGEKAEAQEQISVGMGTLAGSTILLLTIAWGLSLYLGRMDTVERPNGELKCIEKKCTGINWTKQGVQVTKEVMFVAFGMMGTSLAYIIIQSSDWAFGVTDTTANRQPGYVKNCALATMIIAFLGFIGYLASQVYASYMGENVVIEVHEHVKKDKLKLEAAHLFVMAGIQRKLSRVSLSGMNGASMENGLERTPEEVANERARSMGHLWRMKARARTLQRQSMSQDGGIQENPQLSISTSSTQSDTARLMAAEKKAEEEIDGPKWKIALNSFSRLLVGVGLVTFFSDPMCDALGALTSKDSAQHIPIGAFYVSFVVTPLCSNASELVSSLLLSMQKETDKINMTFSQIYGACIMNNTLCLGVFCALIYFKDLEWFFSAEVTVILLFEFVMGILAVVFRKLYPLYLFIIVLTFYPISLGLVAFMENVLNWG